MTGRPAISLSRVCWTFIALLLVGHGGATAGAQEEPPPGLGIRLLEAPRELADDPRARLYIIDHVNPGASFTRRIAVSNGTDEPMRVQLYATAADVDEGWQVAADREQNELASWIAVEPATLTLQAGEVEEVVASVSVPGDAGGGERYAAVIAEGEARDVGGGFELINRVGVRVYLSVAGDGPAPITDFEIDTLQAVRDDAGEPGVLVGVTNTGDRAIDVTGELVLRDGPGQLTAGPFPVATQTTIGSGASSQVVVEMDPEIPSGPWLATATMRTGLVERAAEATITFPEASGESAEPVAATEVPLHQDRGFLIPLAVGLTLLTLLLLFLAWWFLIFRRRRHAEEEQQPAPQVRRESGVGG